MRILLIALLTIVHLGTPVFAVDSNLSDKQIKQILIQRAHASYSGRCPCPYNTMSNGRRCGKRSAYSRPGGASPLCYPADVTDKMVANYRKYNN